MFHYGLDLGHHNPETKQDKELGMNLGHDKKSEIKILVSIFWVAKY